MPQCHDPYDHDRYPEADGGPSAGGRPLVGV